MAWIESHQSLVRHPKTCRAARLLGVKVPTVVGHLHLLWYWALDYAQDGKLGAFEPADIAEAAMWEGDPAVFVDALVMCAPKDEHGFLERVEGDLLIHDWHDYAGRLVEKRQCDAARKKAEREKHRTMRPSHSGSIGADETRMPARSAVAKTRLAGTGEGPREECPQDGPRVSPDVPRTSDGCPTDVSGNRTLPYQEKRDSSEPLPDSKPNEIAFPTVGGGTRAWIPPPELLDELARLYPALDVPFQTKKARLWCVTNPAKQKTARGMPRFLSTWMERTQNDLGRNGSGNGRRPSAAPAEPVDNTEETRKHREWLRENGYPVPGEGPS